ncbi:hypothetical protein B0H17DRAFT_1202146 [Mycena rosella]|uniref:Uncharacterized protein n=1 Tax=Mycena rosella TaxID=1033263 RepID=A0AAD7GIM3_MYCRO|nr:hypothetical protein B0H17DRAFT_1202146 [Mycena rosella]
MDPRFVPQLLHEASRALAEKILPDDHDYRDCLYERNRHRSPAQLHASSSTYASSSGGDHYAQDYGRDSKPRHRYQPSNKWDQWNDREYAREYPRDNYYPQAPYRGQSESLHQQQEYHRGGYRQCGGGYNGCGRAPQRDDRAHNREPGSQPADMLWTRTVYPPDIACTALDNARHPIYPDSGMDDASDPVTYYEIAPPVQYEDHKALQCEDPRGTARAAGRVLTYEQGQSALQWLNHGDRRTMYFIKHLTRQFCTDPTLPRMIGEVTILQYQTQGTVRYNAVVYGHHAARAKLTNQGCGGIIPDNGNAEMRDAPGIKPLMHPVHLGASATADSGNTVFLSEDNGEEKTPQPTVTGLTCAMEWYHQLPTARWPRGMRDENGALPTTDNAPPMARRRSGMMFSVRGTYLQYGLFQGDGGRVSKEEFLRAMPAVLDNIPGDQFMEEIKEKKEKWEEKVTGLWEDGEEPESWVKHNDYLTKDGTDIPDSIERPNSYPATIIGQPF